VFPSDDGFQPTTKMVDEAETLNNCGVRVVTLVDDADDAAAVPPVARLDSAMATGSHIVVDVSRAPCLDKTLATSLCSAHERLAAEGRALAPVVSPGDVARTLHRLGLDRTLPMYVTRAAAIAALSAAQPSREVDA
jgi:anti-anti-sigma regulatory factor